MKTIHWTITKSNTIGKEIKPPFIFEEEKEMLLSHNNVLLEFGLFPTEPFLVFVEGGTEYEILNAYKRQRAGYENLGFVNIQGTGNRVSSIAFIYDSINNSKFKDSKELLLYSIERIFNFAEKNDIKICELMIDPPEILLGEDKKTFIDLCNSYPSITKQFHAPYAYLSLCTQNPWILEASIECYAYSAKISSEIGSQVYTIHPGNAKFLHQSYNRVKNRMIDAVNNLLNKIKGLNVITCIENMPKIAGFFLNYMEIDKFFLEIDRTDAFFTWDTGHSWSCNDDIEKLWERLHTKIKNIHLVEELGNSIDLHPTLGSGSVDFPKVFEIAESYNYNGAMIMELHKVEDLPKSIEFIKKLF